MFRGCANLKGGVHFPDDRVLLKTIGCDYMSQDNQNILVEFYRDLRANRKE